MVKTRTSGEVEESRQDRSSKVPISSHASHGAADGDSPARRTARPLINGYHSDSSDDESPVSKVGNRRPLKRQRYDEEEEDEDDASEYGASKGHKRSNGIAASPQRKSLRPRKASRRYYEDYDDDDDLMASSATRRSTRPKKSTYGTYDQQLIDLQSAISTSQEEDNEDEGEAGQSRRKKEAGGREGRNRRELLEKEREERRTRATDAEFDVGVRQQRQVAANANDYKRETRRHGGQQPHCETVNSDEVLGDKKDGGRKERSRVENKEEIECDVEEDAGNHLRRSRRYPAREERVSDNVQNDVGDASQQPVEECGRGMRLRRPVKRNDLYGMPIHEEVVERRMRRRIVSRKESNSCSDEEGKQNDKDNDDEEEDDEETEEDDEGAVSGRSSKSRRTYNLRTHCPRTSTYVAPPMIAQRKRGRVPQLTSSGELYRPTVRSSRSRSRRKRSAFHSSTSSSDGSSDDEEHFERRKAKSMAIARQRFLPMNLMAEDLASGVLRDRVKCGASLADVEPMNIDKTVMFDSIGGLSSHLRSLKEMVVFPLLYPEVFARFKLAPPKGVLFHGPPGTGKTLVARALANECSHGDTKVAFYMRKGADCLSKWVGESERQLRLLFDQAYQTRPSIIFFDEIDGLAPVRSSRQDQIHSSIVSTLLALMDGLDDRGEIIVIGATNRIDSIDPALRRPGRFDREFLFPLPTYQARREVLHIHTREWTPKLSDAFISDLARKTVGYCGADLKALCTEAALHALRRRFPQIYDSREKLLIDVAKIVIGQSDFYRGMERIVPTARRSVAAPGRALSLIVRPLLARLLDKTIEALRRVFPSIITAIPSERHEGSSSHSASAAAGGVSEAEDLVEDIDLVDHSAGHTRTKLTAGMSSLCRWLPPTHCPRLLLCGEKGQGQTRHLAPAVLHYMENLPVHVIDLPSLHAVGAKTAEESCSQIIHEAKRASPCVLYLPHINDWWDICGEATKATLLSLLLDMDPSIQILLLATCDNDYSMLHVQVQSLFNDRLDEVVHMVNPDDDERKQFFQSLLLKQTKLIATSRKTTPANVVEKLPLAPKSEPRKLTATELKRVQDKEESTLRELRLYLRDVINKLAKDRKFSLFAKAVDIEEVPDYREVIAHPMDLSSMMSKIDLHQYQTAEQFLEDINLICNNALEYNPNVNPEDRAIRHRACALRDTACAIISTELDPEFDKACKDIVKARQARGEISVPVIPSFYFTKPLTTSDQSVDASATTTHSEGARSSRRVRGLEAAQSVNSNTSNRELKNEVKRGRSQGRVIGGKLHRRPFKSRWNRGILMSAEKKRLAARKKATSAAAAAAAVVPNIPEQTQNNSMDSLPPLTLIPGMEEESLPQGIPTSSNVSTSSPAMKSLRTRSLSLSSNTCTQKLEGTENISSATDAQTGGMSPCRSPGKGEVDGSKMECVASTVVEAAADVDPKKCPITPVATRRESLQRSSKKPGRGASADTTKNLSSQEIVLLPVVVDLARLQLLLERIVEKTRGWNVEELEQFYQRLSACVFRYRYAVDKAELVEELEWLANLQLTSS